jgi:hypothetical protein
MPTQWNDLVISTTSNLSVVNMGETLSERQRALHLTFGLSIPPSRDHHRIPVLYYNRVSLPSALRI